MSDCFNPKIVHSGIIPSHEAWVKLFDSAENDSFSIPTEGRDLPYFGFGRSYVSLKMKKVLASIRRQDRK